MLFLESSRTDRLETRLSARTSFTRLLIHSFIASLLNSGHHTLACYLTYLLSTDQGRHIARTYILCYLYMCTRRLDSFYYYGYQCNQ